MQMHRAFNAKMLVPLVWYTISAGSYDTNNIWQPGGIVAKPLRGVFLAGNKFSQFEEGEAIQATDGGARYSDFRSLYVTDIYPMEKDDKVEWKGKYYNILQRSDESAYGFYSYLLERSEEWTP